MDIKKLFEKVMSNEDMKGIPVVFIYLVFNAVIDAINSGECFYIND